MDSSEFQEFTRQLQANLEQDERVLGLVALGSMAQQDYQPDRWSDHDFFVIVQNGLQESFRRNLEWLPDFSQIALAFRETAHGLKVIYKNGHLLEFAVFDLEELKLAGVNRYRVLFDRADIASQMEQLKLKTSQSVQPDDALRFGQFLTNLMVGVGRYSRGERLSGQVFVKTYALGHLLALLKKYKQAPQSSLLDNLDHFRRFEKVFPELGQELNDSLSKDTPQAALQLLAIAERELADKLENYPAEAVEVIRTQIKGE